MSANAVRTAKGDDAFFRAIENGFPVRVACEAARYSRARVYVWRQDDADFAARWARARSIAGDLLEEEADRRGRDGYDEPVFYQGKEVGAKRKYSDSLLHARLKAVRPEDYRDRPAAAAVAQQNVTVVVRDFALEALMRRLVDQKKVEADELPPRLRALVEQPPAVALPASLAEEPPVAKQESKE